MSTRYSRKTIIFTRIIMAGRMRQNKKLQKKKMEKYLFQVISSSKVIKTKLFKISFSYLKCRHFFVFSIFSSRVKTIKLKNHQNDRDGDSIEESKNNHESESE